MVSTRGSQQTAGGRTSLGASGNAEMVTNTVTSSNQISTTLQDPPTIGSRLRKRRRTGSSPIDTVTKQIKTSSSQPRSPEIHRVDPAVNQNIISQQENAFYPDANGDIDNLPSPEMDAIDGGQMQVEVGLDESEIYEEIIDHAETLEKNYYNQRGSSNGDAAALDTYVAVDASVFLKIQTLPILDNLSTQILNTLAKCTYQEIVSLISEPQSEQGQAYQTLKSLFDHTKQVYTQHDPFISTAELQLTEPAHVETVRKANLTTFVSSVFGSSDVGFFPLNEYFLETFVPDGGRLLKVQGGIFLELKTQAYISAMNNGDRSRADLLFDLFPNDLESRLLARRPGARQLAPSEADFVKRAHQRRDYLLKGVNDEPLIAELPQKYRWENFLRDISAYISKNVNNDLNGGTQQQDRKPPKGGRQSVPNGESQEIPQIELENKFSVHTQHSNRSPEANTQEDMVEKAARAARIALGNSISTNQLSPPPMNQQSQSPAPLPQMQTQFQEYTYPPPPESAQRQPNDHSSFGDIPEIPYHTQSAPTQVLYERARQAAITKVSPASRRAGLPSQRRPWSTEEENALMAGLDRVKGPHWSQILAMFGPGGTINETLKDRNQVQLKDKARNLKLFFLKSGIEVPYYLQFVTGELKTRAPAQAAKNEAKEREQSAYDDDKAHIEGVMGVLGLANASQLMEEGGIANGDGLSGEDGMNEEYPSARDQLTQYAMSAQPVDQNPHRPQITGGVVTT